MPSSADVAPHPGDEFFPSRHRGGLFQSRAWRDAWLKCWGNHPRLRALDSTADAGPELFLYREWKKGFIPVSTAIPVGVTSPAAQSIRSEYLCIANNAEHPTREVEQYLDRALQHRWDQLILPDIIAETPEHAAIVEAARARGLDAVEQERETAYAVDLRKTNFSDYLTSLGKNTRLQLYNRRKRLLERGEVKIENLWPDRQRFYRLLNEFHLARWGKPCYKGRNLEFIETLLTNLHEAGSNIDLSLMTVAGEPVSVTLDINAQGRCYNLQSGYVENYEKGVSLGKLHLGYQIEKAYESCADHYDFMVGSGKNTPYKIALANAKTDVVSLRVTRSPYLRTMLRIGNRLNRHGK